MLWLIPFNICVIVISICNMRIYDLNATNAVCSVTAMILSISIIACVVVRYNKEHRRGRWIRKKEHSK